MSHFLLVALRSSAATLISNNQIRFLKGHRTVDHVLFIDTIIHEIVHKHRKCLFVAFVVLKKAYDRVNRKFMVYKLRRKSFSGKCLKIIEAMINSIIQISKSNGRLLSTITTLLCLKQGDDLSPDIFFDDVEEIFDDSCNPIKLPNGLSVNHCLYADDMATLSFSSEGLQNSLNRLYTYCNKCKIEVCTVKTTILIFNTSGKLLKGYRFHYNGKILEQIR